MHRSEELMEQPSLPQPAIAAAAVQGPAAGAPAVVVDTIAQELPQEAWLRWGGQTPEGYLEMVVFLRIVMLARGSILPLNFTWGGAMELIHDHEDGRTSAEVVCVHAHARDKPFEFPIYDVYELRYAPEAQRVDLVTRQCVKIPLHGFNIRLQAVRTPDAYI
eukprot:CAMPEP_0115595816 /NCGR_PEP_ID=MMETSP0272-20121206/12514_1 /TAXON_ID=71861 /ORGANISM="Scrippsiella trochoidea, Strain CCMP3099" /LENGTH=161 /DNA_ID=CAMNT_0003031133 /DNA_START=306 /DNA_END=791 /DNA_ORIENTATION=+